MVSSDFFFLLFIFYFWAQPEFVCEFAQVFISVFVLHRQDRYFPTLQ